MWHFISVWGTCPLKSDAVIKAQCQLTDPSLAVSNWTTWSGWKALTMSKRPLSCRWSQPNGCTRKSFFRLIRNEGRKIYFPQLLHGRARLHGKVKHEGWGVAWLQMQETGPCFMGFVLWEKVEEENKHLLSQDRGFLGSSKEQQPHRL